MSKDKWAITMRRGEREKKEKKKERDFESTSKFQL